MNSSVVNWDELILFEESQKLIKKEIRSCTNKLQQVVNIFLIQYSLPAWNSSRVWNLWKGLYYHHDFVALLSKIHKRLKIFNFAIIFILCLPLYSNFFSKNHACQAFLICRHLIFKNINQYYKSKIKQQFSRSLIGDGPHDSNFISSDLFPYNDALSNMIGIFKFHIYVADSMKLAILNNNSNLYECNIPLNLLICRLKLSELKLVHDPPHTAHSCRGLYSPSP